MSGSPRRKGPPPWRAVRSRTCIPTPLGPGTVRPCRGRPPGRGPLRTARGHGRACPESVARHRPPPRCGVRRARATAVRPGTQLARLPGAVLLAHRAPRRSPWRQVLLSIVVTHLLLVFLALVIYLGRHAGT
ncbi:hypothetical protein SAMN05216511_6530 [Streptomyces sp. KS_16]|uniref:hypothetical protein n=1 Tax=Streptomyces sp. NPDC047049 TaxID=3156688 RepID=UPI00087EA3BE|nr:hypothetical protein BX261_0690 [Streptomyces sp. 2321.6]SDR57098.1 hypothetical protein SAMN05216511_6530 [Streptomyces sp. KS_16]SEB90843.1 hypothetical protein SAMN05428940_0689 [Streptomyces sp. 2133.1]SNC62439.1 hypothetical protein SAMN06272741_0689 [Streptomyces sp. 2114.4]